MIHMVRKTSKRKQIRAQQIFTTKYVLFVSLEYYYSGKMGNKLTREHYEGTKTTRGVGGFS